MDLINLAFGRKGEKPEKKKQKEKERKEEKIKTPVQEEEDIEHQILKQLEKEEETARTIAQKVATIAALRRNNVEDETLKKFYKEIEELAKTAPLVSQSYILAAALLALEKGLHKDPEKLAKFLVSYTHKKAIEYAKNPPTTDLELARRTILGISPYNPRKWYRDLIIALISFEQQLPINEAKKIKKILERVEDLYEATGYADYEVLYPEIVEEIDRIAKQKLPDLLDQEPEEILGLKPEKKEEERKKEEKLAPKILAHAIIEDLPTAAYRIATIAKLLEENAIPPETAQQYLHLLHSNHTPQGRGLYNLLYRLLENYEKTLKTGQKPQPPSKEIEKIITQALHETGHHKPWETTRETLEQATTKIHPAWIEAKTALGIPIPSTKAAKAVKTLIEKLEKLETGEADPLTEDTKLEITTLVKALKQTTQEEEPTELIQAIRNPNAWEYYYNTIMEEYHNKAAQTPHQKLAQALREASETVKKRLQEIDPQQPYYRFIAQTLREIREKLSQTHGEYETLKTTNIMQQLLLTYPLYLAAKLASPGQALAIYRKGVEEEPETTLTIRTLHELYQKIKQQPPQEAIQTVLTLKTKLETLDALKTAIHRHLEAIQEKQRETGKETPLTAKHIAKGIMETIRSISLARREKI